MTSKRMSLLAARRTYTYDAHAPETAENRREMFAVLSFPVIDFRDLTSGKRSKLPRPTFPTPEVGSDFIRGFGGVERRKKGGAERIAGEHAYSDSKGALRFVTPALPEPNSGPDWEAEGLRPLFRRLYHTGHGLLRYELGFKVVEDFGRASAPENIVSRIGRILVRIPEAGQTVWLCDAGAHLATAYLRASTRMDKGRLGKHVADECFAASGQIVLEYRMTGQFHEPEGPTSSQVQVGEGVRLHHTHLQGVGGVKDLWVIVSRPDADERLVRQIRIHLTRLHTEYQFYHALLNAMAREDKQEWSHYRLLDRLQVMTQLLEKERRHGAPQLEILEVALSAMEATKPGYLASLFEAGRKRIKEVQLTIQEEEARQNYTAQPWERIVASGVAVLVVFTVLWLVIRNEPIADDNLVVLIRVLLAVSVAIIGAVVPGFLQVSWKGRGLLIRAGGALALVVLALVFTPKVL